MFFISTCDKHFTSFLPSRAENFQLFEVFFFPAVKSLNTFEKIKLFWCLKKACGKRKVNYIMKIWPLTPVFRVEFFLKQETFVN